MTRPDLAKWEKKFNQQVKFSGKVARDYEKFKPLYEKLVAACTAYTSGYATSASLISEARNGIMDRIEETSRAAAELMVYADELDAAEKAKDKAEIKKWEKKMAPLAKSYKASIDAGQKSLDAWWKETDKLSALSKAVSKAAVV